MDRFFFPSWVNTLLKLVAPVATLGLIYVVLVTWYGPVPKTMDVGFQPTQPVPFSHKIHAGDLKMDCRYCHTSVETAAFAAVPPTATCLNCHGGKVTDRDGKVVEGQTHTAVHLASEKLAPVRESGDTNMPVEWIKVHDLPDYVYFNHSAHVTRGVSCVECHGRIDRMEQVFQAKELSMSWCLSCHRDPEPHLRPTEFVTKLDSTKEEWAAALIAQSDNPKKDLGFDNPATATAQQIGEVIKREHKISPSTHCSTCHR